VVEKTLRADARRNLELILQAAAETFAERGLEASVADVAARAGVGNATIFRRFATKDELIDAVLEMRLHEMADVVRQAAEQPGGIAAVRGFLARAVELQVRDKAFLECVGKPRFVALPAYARIEQEMLAALDQMMVKAQAAGEVRSDVSGADLPVLLHSLCHGALMLESDDARDRYVDIFCDGLRPVVTAG
jgi:AcrR family transcriptional regulator